MRKLHLKTRTRSLECLVVYLDHFEIWHLKIQDGRQLSMQIRLILRFSLLLTPSVLNTKYEVFSMFNTKKVFLMQTFP